MFPAGTNRIYDFAKALVGWLRGGLGHVNIGGSVIFAGMSGTAVADAGGLGTIEIKAMKDHGYDLDFAVGVTAASSTIGPIIPPSLPMVIYGVMANASIGQLFAAGLDVFRKEPDFDTRLAALPNVFLTPHVASATVDTRDAMGFRTLDNIAGVLSGRGAIDPV